GSGVRELVATIPDCKIMFQDSSTHELKRPPGAAAAAAQQGEAGIAGWLRSIGGTLQMRDGHVAAVSLKSTSVTDRELEILAKLPQLAELNLRDTEISDVGAAHLSSIHSLQKLDLGFTLLSDSSLARLTPLTSLETLYLGNTL